MGDVNKLQSNYDLLKTGTLWSSNGKCKGYAIANPGEAIKIDQYIADLVASINPTPPQLATATGKGLVGIIDAGFPYTPPAPPPTTVALTSSIADGATLTGPTEWEVTPDSAVGHVKFFIDGNLKWTENAPPWIYYGDGGVLDLANGPHGLQAVATDDAGTEVGHIYLSITVNAPVIDPPPPTGVGPIWNGDLSTDNLSQWGGWEYGGTFDGTPPLSQRVVVAQSLDGYTPPGGLKNLMRIDVADGDIYGSSTGYRAVAREYEPIKRRTAGYDGTWVWAQLVPPGFPGVPQGDLWQAGLEFHNTGEKYYGPAPFHCYVYSSNFRVDSYGTRSGVKTKNADVSFMGGYQQGAWYVWVVRYKHDRSNGAVQVYCGKKGGSLTKYVDFSGLPTMYDGDDNYELFGQYRAQTPATGGKTRMYVAGAKEYANVNDALAWANKLIA